MKEDFNAGDDLWSKEYSESKLSNAEKNALFERYMTLADAHIKRIQEKKDEAKDLYQSLLSDKDASKYLRFQAQSSLQQL